MTYYSTIKFGFEHSFSPPWGSEWYPAGRHTYTIFFGSKKVGEISTAGRRTAPYGWRVEADESGRSHTIGERASLFEAKQLFAKTFEAPTKNSTNIVSYLADPNAEFYPTPENLAGKMFRYIQYPRHVSTILEPSAGKGDLVELYVNFMNKHSDNKGWNRREFNSDNIDTIEKDPNLIALLRGKNYRVIGDDFLRFTATKTYDLIIMNPPFSNGDEHLLKAIQIQENGGQIVCLLNAETIRNPYTNRRKLLAQKLAEYGAKIEFVCDAFKKAQRKTDVEVAIVYVNIPEPERKSFIFENLKKAQEDEMQHADPEALVYGDWAEQMVQSYQFEAKLGKTLIEEYNALAPYIKTAGTDPLIHLSINGKTYSFVGTEGYTGFLEGLRLKYWRSLLDKEEFSARMTSDMRTDFQHKLNSLKDYDFSLFNLMQVYYDVNMQVEQGVKDSIMKLFDTFSSKHSWYPECENNIHYYNGWKTNKAHKVGMKVIVPIDGYKASYQYVRGAYKDVRALDSWTIINRMDDLERALNYLDRGETTYRRNMRSFVEHAVQAGKNTVELTYFTATFYKKGTCHIKFRPEAAQLIDRLNIFAARERTWLPPTYGKKHYADMTTEEKTVIDEFQGAESYEKLMVNPGYYIADVSSMALPMLSAGE